MSNQTEREAFESWVVPYGVILTDVNPYALATWDAFQAGAAYQRAQPSSIEITKLISCVRYLTGIAERGLKRQIREDESVESFVLGYVQSLETQPSDDVAKDAARWDMLVKIYDHVLTHPDSRTHDAEYGRYKTAIEAGLGITGAIDAAMAGGGK